MLGGRQTLAPAAVMAIALAGCGGGGGDGSASSETQAATVPDGCTVVHPPRVKEGRFRMPAEQLSGPASALVRTNCGSFTIELDTARAPKTTSSFAGLVKQGLYDDTLIHRIEPGFVVQGGDPVGNGTGGPGYHVDEPPPSDLTYTRGTVAMARTTADPPGRSGSQFFVVTAPADAGLPPDYALLGMVSEGFETLERIEGLVGPDGQVAAPAVIEKIALERG